ncbi:hypothetical protein Q0F98_15205 [Paenibacillus amylolyticus]|nr:hypothetical protein Q0F98_15205 [Paenibacillus amylolyticus]
MERGYEHMAEEGLSEETIQRRIRQNRMEMKIGLSWINKVAILLLILGGWSSVSILVLDLV